jgi:hypothetical protein
MSRRNDVTRQPRSNALIWVQITVIHRRGGRLHCGSDRNWRDRLVFIFAVAFAGTSIINARAFVPVNKTRDCREAFPNDKL